MFEDRLYDNIMEEMMEGFGAEVRTDEGSLAYNSCARQAMKLEEVYADMEDIYDNMLPDRMELDYLIRYAKERGVDYNYATCPVVKGVFSQEIELGEMLACGDYDYEVKESLGGFAYALACTTAGVEANTNFGELEPSDYIEDYGGGEITELLEAGVADEDVEVFRARVMGTFQNKAFGGNKAAYREYINGLTGIGGCKPRRREADSSYINVYVISQNYSIPPENVVAKVQELVDPEQSQGEGDGMAPIGHNVIIKAVEGVAVDVSVQITWDNGYGMDTSASRVAAAVEGYLLSLRKGWEGMEDEGITVRISQVEAALLSVEGVLDVSSTLLNGMDSNVMLSYEQIPLKGEVYVL